MYVLIIYSASKICVEPTSHSWFINDMLLLVNSNINVSYWEKKVEYSIKNIVLWENIIVFQNT